MIRRVVSILRAASPADWLAAGVFAIAFVSVVWLPAIVETFR